MSAAVLFAPASVRDEARPEQNVVRQATGWNWEDFVREQIRGLVRQVFFSNGTREVRQVVFSALELETDVRTICRQVGEELALETEESIAVVGEYPLIMDAATQGMAANSPMDQKMPLQQSATRLRSNLWLVPQAGKDGVQVTNTALHSYLKEVRRQFDYSIVAGPRARESNDIAAIAQCADGLILVLAANRTRRVMALKVKEALQAAQACILGIVLSDRVFPMPEGIYRRL